MSSSMRLCTASGILLLGLGLATTADATELVTNGDFSAGDTGFSSDYTDVTGNGPGAGPFNNGEYSIGTDPSQAPDRFGDWQSFGDHTTGTGNMLIADGAPNQTPIRVWYEAGITLSASTIYNFSFSDHEVQGGTGPSADLVFEVNDVVQGSDLVLPLSGAGTSWEEDSGTITGISGPVTLSIVDLDTSGPFNDFALDDISLTGPSATPVPEPSSWALMLSALGVMAIGLRICRPGYLASENAIG
jgi:PEP-CTERM motif